MARKRIGILTGGGDVPGLNSVIKEVVYRGSQNQGDVIGIRRGSGFTQANVDHGAQNRSHVDFARHARHVSAESAMWRGYYYGVNALKPCLEPILLAQKPTATCTSAGLATTSATLPDSSGLQDPGSSSSSVYNGVEPSITSAPRVIQGQVMY